MVASFNGMAQLDILHSVVWESALYKACLSGGSTASKGKTPAGSCGSHLTRKCYGRKEHPVSAGTRLFLGTGRPASGIFVVAVLCISVLRFCVGESAPPLVRGVSDPGEPPSRSRVSWPPRQGREQKKGGINEPLGTSAVADRILRFLSDFATQVGSDVKNSIMQQVSQVRTSKLYKRAKHLVNPPSIDGSVVAEKLLHAGEGLLDFHNVFQQIPPDERHVTLSRIFSNSNSLRRVRRKYVHLDAHVNPQTTFDSLGALGRFMREVNKVVTQDGGVKVPGEALVTDPTRHDREILPIFEVANRLLARSLSVLGYLLTQDGLVAVELATFIRQMLPRWKQVFAQAWKLSGVLTPSEQREAQCTLADCLDDLLLFDSGLRATAETLRESGALTFDPENYYFTTPSVPSSVLYVDTAGITS